MNLAILLQYIFLGLSLNILLATLFPSVSSRFMHYGARSQLKKHDADSKEKSRGSKDRNDEDNGITNHDGNPQQKESQNQKSNYREQQHPSILDSVAAKRLPHHYFTHFYIFSLACLFFWAYQILSGGLALGYLISLSSFESQASLQSTVTMPLSRVLLGWTLLLIQSVRRLYESLILASKPSNSSMWIGHYLVGLTFYLLVNPAVYIAEALPTLQTLLKQQQQQQQNAEASENPPVEGLSHAQKYESALMKMTSVPDIKVLAAAILSRPIASAVHALATMRFRTAILLPLFILASALQHDAHMHLASLKDKSTKDVKKVDNSEEISSAIGSNSNISSSSSSSKNTYSIPTHPLFSRLIAPHYTLEVAIYIIIALLAAPDHLEGTLVSKINDNNSNDNNNLSTTSSSSSSSSISINRTTLPVNYSVAAAAIFAAVNLGVTAAGTRQWYAARFGREAAVQRKWTLVPFIW